MLIGYKRVSTLLQNTARQLDGVQLDKCFEDKASGKNIDERPALEQLIEFARDGDVVIVHSMDRLARNLKDLREIVDELVAKNASVQFLKENLTFGGNDAPMSKLLLNILGAFAEFEREMILERQREGIAVGKKNGKFKGRKPTLSEEDVKVMCGKIAAGIPKALIARQLGVSRATLYSYLKKRCPHHGLIPGCQY